MSGSRLGRGRGGRLAIYGGCGVIFLCLVFLYRAATSEMAKLQELHLKCVQQQEALAAQLQVIFEYKARLEKSLAEEKSSHVAVKQELQQRATREKSLHDKDSVEAMQRFNSLQQTYKLLQTEHQDLQEECKKHEKQALDETSRLEATLQDLRGRMRQVDEDKKAFADFKIKYMLMEQQKEEAVNNYNELMKNRDNSDSIIEHLKKKAFQLEREIKLIKKSYGGGATSFSPIFLVSSEPSILQKEDLQPIPSPQRQQQLQNAVNDDSASLRKTENSTVASANNLPSTSPKVMPLPIKSSSKIRLPIGVLPIPQIMEQRDNAEEKHEDMRKRENIARNSQLKLPSANADSKEKDAIVDGGNLDPPFVANSVVRHLGQEQVQERRPNGWFRVVPGVQEIGEELNQMGRVPGLDDGQANGGDDQYDAGDYDKEPQQKNDIQLAEGEDEGEDEGDMVEYSHDLKQEKRD